MSPRHVVLVGMMGSGKSTVGRLAAAEMDRPFLDADRVIEKRAGRTIAEIFAGDGEPAFRELETEVLAELLSDDEPAVIAAGGGAVLDAGTRAKLRERGYSVWLRATVPELRARLGSSVDRPLLASVEDLAATLDHLTAEREPVYEEVADLTIDVDGTDPVEVARAVVDAAAQVRT